MIGSLLLLGALALLLVSAGIEDVRCREIANGKNIAIALLAPLWWWPAGIAPWPQLGLAAIVFAVFVAAFHFRMMGGGDVKMIGALALWLPLQPLIWMLIVMSLVGAGVTVIAAIAHKRRRAPGQVEVPYGVAIAIAGLVSIGEPFLNQFSQYVAA